MFAARLVPMREVDCARPATELADRIKRGTLSPVTLVEAYLERIERRDDDLNAYVTVCAGDARKRAERAERAVENGSDLGLLHGVPIALKDVFGLKAGVRNTFCSAPFAEFVPEEDSTFVSRLEAAGAIVLGKTNAPEFATKGTTDNLLIGPTSNPFDLERNAGGSSGGSAAAVADGLAAVAHGSDGGGSLRIPAAWCGVYAFKPTYRRVPDASRPDAFASHTPFAHHGPISRTVDDAALLLDVMAGPHERDPHSLPDTGTSFREATDRSLDGVCVGYSPDLGTFPVDERVRSTLTAGLEGFGAAGATLRNLTVDLGHDHAALVETWLDQVAVVYASAADAFARREDIHLLEDHRAELTDELVALIERGQALSAVEYKRCDRVRTDVFDGLVDALEHCDLLVTPTLAVPPVRNATDGHTVGPSEVNGEAVDPLIGWCLTFPVNFTGHPAASVPIGTTPEGLPVGAQIIGSRFDDELVLAASAALERERPWSHLYQRLRG
jgi:aspartyl-tRNA(Asn)/glutamyl-tRNA(Gln) amidotransferase subunit A